MRPFTQIKFAVLRNYVNFRVPKSFTFYLGFILAVIFCFSLPQPLLADSKWSGDIEGGLLINDHFSEVESNRIGPGLGMDMGYAPSGHVRFILGIDFLKSTKENASEIYLLGTFGLEVPLSSRIFVACKILGGNYDFRPDLENGSDSVAGFNASLGVLFFRRKQLDVYATTQSNIVLHLVDSKSHSFSTFNIMLRWNYSASDISSIIGRNK